MNNAIGSAISALQMNSGQLDQLTGGLNTNSKSGAVSDAERKQLGETFDGAGKDFESVFMSMLLKEMRNTLDSEEGGLFGAESSDTFGGMFDMFMGQHMAEAQPIGIGDAISAYMAQKLDDAP